MDPATISLGIQAAAFLLQTVQQYTNGEITQEQAHAQFTSSQSNLIAAIAAFEAAKQPSESGS